MTAARAAVALAVCGAISTAASFAVPRAAAAQAAATQAAATQDAAADPGAARQALARARAAYADVRTARAEFTQAIRNPLTGRVLESRGTLQQRKPGRLAVTFTEPAGDRIVSDGTYLWVYIPSSAPGQVLRFPAGAGGTGGVDLAATILETPEDAYVVRHAGRREADGRSLEGVALTQKPGALAPFPRATLWIATDDWSVREVAVTDPQGVSRTIRITRWQPNVAVDANVFRFAVPDGVRIVEP
jgi:outer membrane lipoprotein carrier protein